MHRGSRFLVLVAALACAASLVPSGLAKRESFVHDPIIKTIDHYRAATWHWQDVMGVHRTPFAGSARRSSDTRYRHWVMRLWKHRAAAAHVRATHVPHASAWLCIHRYEGGWSSHTGNGYYGGLQMDISFMRHYAWGGLLRKGTADRWSPLEQMWVAERALAAGRGFYPWPNTARACGLI